MGPFYDAATATRNWLSELWNGEKQNDYEGVDPAEDPTRANEVLSATQGAIAAGATAAAIAQANQALAMAKAEQQKQLMWLVGAGVVGYVLFSGKSKRKKRRR